MKIVSAASAFPKNIYSQQDITGALARIWGDQLERPEVLERLHANCGAAQRHLALDLEKYLEIETFGQANNIWIEVAQQLGEEFRTGGLMVQSEAGG